MVAGCSHRNAPLTVCPALLLACTQRVDTRRPSAQRSRHSTGDLLTLVLLSLGPQLIP
jgi:hypothetical protein